MSTVTATPTAAGVKAPIAPLVIPGLPEPDEPIACNFVPSASDLPLRRRVGLEIANLKQATAVIVAHHYLHRGRTMAQLPYWVTLDGIRIGVLLFSLPRMSVPFCHYVPMSLLELARMWLAPGVQGLVTVDSRGQNHAFAVASCAVGRALRQCRHDWQDRYPRLPAILAVVSWADREHHEGIIYRAANFREVGESGGSLHGAAYRKNGGHDQRNADYLHKKRAFLFEFGNGGQGLRTEGLASRSTSVMEGR